MGVKYYYSAPLQIRSKYILADAQGNELADWGESILIKSLPRVTVCSILDGNKLSFGYATCSDRELYSKNRGRVIAYARAIGKPYAVFELSDLKDVHEVSSKIVDEIFDLESKRIYK